MPNDIAAFDIGEGEKGAAGGQVQGPPPHMQLPRVPKSSTPRKILTPPSQHHHLPTMAPYDSDSSDNEEFEETNVLLGYVDDEPPEGQDLISHLGGQPVCSPTPPSWRSSCLTRHLAMAGP